MRYEWDEAKRAANLAKHGVDFADAVGALEDSSNLTTEDVDSANEQRFVTLGSDLQSRLLVVVWAERHEDVVRIISARRASRGETRHYPRQ